MGLTDEKTSGAKFRIAAFLASKFGLAAKRYLVVGGADRQSGVEGKRV